MKNFVYGSLPTRVVFGAGSLSQLAREIDALGSSKALILSTPGQRAKDGTRDKWLKRSGWTTLRFGEHEVLHYAAGCIGEIYTAVEALGGLKGRNTIPGT